MAKKEDKYLNFKIKQEDFYKALVYRSFLENHLSKQHPHLNKTLHKFFDLFEFVEEQVQKQYDKNFTDKSTVLYNYFVKVQGYNKDTLQGIIDDILVHLFTIQITTGKQKKKDFIDTCYKFIRDNNKTFSHFQIAYITALITLLFGYPLSPALTKMYKTGEQITTSELFAGIRSPVKKFNKK